MTSSHHGPYDQGYTRATMAYTKRSDHHYTYAFMGDGCMMEGISHEVCSLAGTLKLGKLVAFYDDNGISIDGHVEGWFTDDTAKRFEAYGWHVVRGVDGHDADAIKRAVEEVALHGGFLPYTSTFLMFVEYARNAVRMAALMKQRQVMVYTHDSIGLGEDGPTHQPVEQVASLRVTPNMSTWRPCDQVESAIAWKYEAGCVSAAMR